MSKQIQSTKHKIQNTFKTFGVSKLFWIFDFGFGAFRARRGFTLLETIIALTLLVAALAGPVTLATRGIFNARFAKNKLIAANLAQEGLEMVRKFRDDNVLARRAWDFGIGVGDWQADILAAGLSPFTGAPLLRDTSTGLYNYTSGGPSLFARRITITKPAADQMSVVSQLTWIDAGISRNMTLREILYNWR